MTGALELCGEFPRLGAMYPRQRVRPPRLVQNGDLQL